MKAVYWAKLAIAKDKIISRMHSVKGAEVEIIEAYEPFLARLAEFDFVALSDPHDTKVASEIRQAIEAPGSKVKYLHFISAGREGFEAAGYPRDVKVTTPAGAVAPTVAEHALALALGLMRRVPETAALQTKARWDRSVAPRLQSLEGGTCLIVGLGRIGEEVARRARAFGMRVIAVTRTPKDNPAVDAVFPLSDLKRLIPEAKMVVLSLALTPDTRGIFGEAEIGAMRSDAILVNVGRGGLMDQKALTAALIAGRIAGAATDVTDPEPLPDGDPFWSAPNLIISCHFAGAGSPQTLTRLAESVGVSMEAAMSEMAAGR